MDNSIAISLREVSKKYKLYSSPKERFQEALHPFQKKYHREFWALRDISFDLQKGQTLGIIGRNGSGKSTLLQIICSVLRPTKGEVAVNGRISALLELGAGFNPEFTGRENVLFQGTLMGFSTQEMEDRLPDIEAFADIGEFIDQPVRMYSSGMFARLAFATAIHVDPDILVVDEALSVGDAKFQHKCFLRFHDFQKAGKTILFVSHDIHSVIRNCDRAVLIDKGHIISTGDPKDVTNQYLNLLGGSGEVKSGGLSFKAEDSAKDSPPENPSDTELERFLKDPSTEDQCVLRKSYNKDEFRHGDKRGEILDYLLVCGEDSDPNHLEFGSEIEIFVKILFHQSVESPAVGISIKTVDGVLIYACNTRHLNMQVSPVKESEKVIFKFSVKMNLQPADYFLDLGCGEWLGPENQPIDRRYGMIHLHVTGEHRFDGLTDIGSQIVELSRDSISEHRMNIS